MKSMKARVAERGQVTIPKTLRERLGVKPGTILEFSEERGRLVATKSGGIDAVREVYGCLGKRISTDAVMAQLRERRRSRQSVPMWCWACSAPTHNLPRH